MSLENEDHVQKCSKLRYTRDFLLSLSEFDACKKLPSGLDASILSDYGDASSTGFERQRNFGGLSLQSSKRGENGSRLQKRPESLNQGRWDTRSTGSSDKDGELQSDWESVVQDSGRPFGNQTRCNWQNSEHDGLLGNGAFPRPAGYAGPSAAKARGNDAYQLSRSTEPYQPPRPYKAMPFSRKDTDSYNAETFGATECSSEVRAEEERKRRESFELMRKEQRKVLQEKQKQNPDNHNENLDADMLALLGNSADENNISKNKSDDPVVVPLFLSDSSRSSLHIQAPASRPLVPPGFQSSTVDKNFSVHSLSTAHSSEVASAIVESKQPLSIFENNQDNGNVHATSALANAGENVPNISSQFSSNISEKFMVPRLSLEALNEPVDFRNMSGKEVVQDTNEVWEDDIVIMNDSSCKKGLTSEIVNTAIQDQSTPILEKLFSNALSKNMSSPFSVEHQGVKAHEEKQSPSVFESSMFAHWFFEEGKKSQEDFSSRELLNLIVGNEKSVPQVSTSSEKANQHIPLNFAFESAVTPSKLPTSSASSSIFGVPEQYSQSKKTVPSSAVLTCEDLEQSILAEVKDTNPSLHHTVQEVRNPSDSKSDRQKADIDGHASLHILSLLQKGTSSKESIPFPSLDIIESIDNCSGSHIQPSCHHISDNVAVRNSDIVHRSEQTLTLETLFGASFMNALRSAEAPVSAQRGAVGAQNNDDIMQPHEVPATSHESTSRNIIREEDIPSLNYTHKDNNVPDPELVSYADSPLDDSKITGIEGGVGELQLPEEDSLITVSATVNPISANTFSFENAHKLKELLPENKDMENLKDKFLNATFRDGERLRAHVSDGLTQQQKSPLKIIDFNDLYHHLHGRSTSQFPHQIDQTRPLFSPLDHFVQRNHQMKFSGPDGMHHEPHHRFPGNLFPHHAFNNMGAQRFDPAAAHHPMLHNFPIQGKFPHHHPVHSLPGGVPSSHPINHVPGYIHEMNNMHNFPLHNRQPNFGGGFGMGLPGPVVGGSVGTQPDALQRLIEVEMRTNSKQIDAPPGVHIPGIYGPENINLRYR